MEPDSDGRGMASGLGGPPVRLAVDARMAEHSGIGTYLRNILERLAARPDLEITFLGDRRILEKYPWFDRRRFIPLTSPIYRPQEQLELAARVPACDVLWSPHYNVPVLPTRARRRAATIHDVYHLAFKDALGGLSRAYARFLLGRAAFGSQAVITVSEFSRSEMGRLMGVPPEKVTVIPNGVDPAFAAGFEPGPSPGDYVLAVGNLKPHKNLRLAVQAFKRIHQEFPELKLVIVGKNEGLLTLEKDFAAAYRDLPEGKVVLAGEVTSRELRNYYYHARLFVFPSLYEGFGLPVLEAMSFGVPIAASSAGPIREVAGDAVGYFDPRDAADMARCMAEALRRPPGAGREGYRERLEMFSWDRSARRHAEIMVALGRAGRDEALGR